MENEPVKKDMGSIPEPQATQDVESSSSLVQDFFIVGFGILIVVLAFFLYHAIVGLDLEVVMPRGCKKVIDMYGHIISTPDNKIPGQHITQYIRIAIIMGFAAIGAFFFSFVIIKWIKNNKKLTFRPKPFDKA
ncbi:MAG: hypothetical protein PHY73_03730 [Candidatus Omnitrophica bacterium]|nr:hypothetical protein [Candidatus Omnitrophota bacterium]